MRFYEQFYGFHALRTVGKCTSRHLVRYGLSPLGQIALLILAAASVTVLVLKVTRPSIFGRVPSYFEALWYPHLYFYRKSNA